MNDLRLPLAMFLLLSLASCTVFDHHASEARPIRVEVPALRALSCVTHNGEISIAAGTADTVEGVATVTAWAETDERAKEELADLKVLQEQSGGELRLSLQVPDGRRGDVSFELRVPPGSELILTSHDGSISTAGVSGVLRAESHNGEVRFEHAKGHVEVVAHNGAITGGLDAGAVDGSITAHNGAVEVAVDPACSTRVDISTHNGSIELIGASDTNLHRGSASGTFGRGEGKLSIASHNGSVSTRAK